MPSSCRTSSTSCGRSPACTNPTLLLLSAGYDAHADDPLAGCSVTDGGYRSLAALLRATADELGVPLGLVLEGGYDLGALSRSVVATLEAIGAPEPAPPAVVEPHPLAERARERLAARHWPAMASA